MFNIFKKKSDLKLDSVQLDFISTIINKLSEIYPLFKQEFELETFVGIGKNPGGSKGSFTYIINYESWKRICNPNLDNYDIKNILFKTFTGDKISVDLYTSEGLIVGYKSNVEVKDIDVSTIDISEIWEKHFLNNDYFEIEHIFKPLTNEQLNKLSMVKNTFKIEVHGTSYYPVHDIGDGNYVAIDKEGEVFKITHDPFEVQKIYESILIFLKNEFS